MKVNESKYKLVVNHVINDIDKIKNYSEKVNVCFLSISHPQYLSNWDFLLHFFSKNIQFLQNKRYICKLIS